MLLNLKDISYIHPDREILFTNISLSLNKGDKISLIGDNGSGKSTLLKIICGELKPASGSLYCAERLFFVPQHFGQYDHITIAEALGIHEKLQALHAILEGSSDAFHFNILADDWEIEEKAAEALRFWDMDSFDFKDPLETLSGGEKTRIFLAGAMLSGADLILMDEPTNHLDHNARKKLYSYIIDMKAAVIVVSHDRTLLNLIDKTFLLTADGITLYGGNYDFFRVQRDTEIAAIEDTLDELHKSLNKAKKVAKETAERKQKKDARGSSKMKKQGIPRIMLKKITDGAASTDKKLRKVHEEKIESIGFDIKTAKTSLPPTKNFRIKLIESEIHDGKILFKADKMNFRYPDSEVLWQNPLDIVIRSGERINIKGPNGSGKTTLLKLILGEKVASNGNVSRIDFKYLYIDQEYSLLDDSMTVLGQVYEYAAPGTPDHLIKTELHRFLFPFGTWEKRCGCLSGGEKMRLIFCSLVLSGSAPELIAMDEPTNNLDIGSLETVASVLADYEGTLLVISHDEYFLKELNIDSEIIMPAKLKPDAVA